MHISKNDSLRKQLMLIITCLLMLLKMPVQQSAASSVERIFALPTEDAVAIYHTVQLPVGHGFNVYRRELPGDPFQLLNEEPVRAAGRASELRQKAAGSYDELLAFFEASDEAGLWMAMRTNPVQSNIATILYPGAAHALGRLFVDESAPRNREVTYMLEFVNSGGVPTGKEMRKQVTVVAPEIQVPEITNVESTGRRVTFFWHYPGSDRDETDHIIQFYVYRTDQESGELQRLTEEVIIRNNAIDDHMFTIESPVVNRTETYVMTAVNFIGQESEPSTAYTYELIDDIPPAPVRNLAMRIIDDRWVELRWDRHPDPDVIGYHVYRGTDLSQPLENITPETVPGDQLVYLDSTAIGGRTSYYYVKGVTAVGVESTESDLVMAQLPDLLPPTKPHDFRAAFNEDRMAVEMTWEVDELSDHFSSFVIMRRREDVRSPGGAFSKISPDHLQATHFEDRGPEGVGLSEGYSYRYVLYSASHSMNYSDTLSALVEIPYITPPKPPAGLRALNDNGLRARVSWNASPSSHTEAYFLYRQQADASLPAKVATLPVNSRLYRDRDVQVGKTYVYTVTAVDPAGNESDPSLPDTLFFRSVTPPPAVRNVQAAANEDGVQLTWERVASPHLAGYRVTRANIPTGQYLEIHEGLLEDTRFLDEEGGAGHWYRVRAVDTSGNESRPGDPVRPISP